MPYDLSLIGQPLHAARTSLPLVVTAGAVLAVILFLFAFPLASVLLAFAVPLSMVAVVSGFAVWMNARTSMWHGRRPFFFGLADWGFLGCFAAFAAYGFANVEASAHMAAYVFVGVLFIAACRFAFMEFEAWWLGIGFVAVRLLLTGEYLLFTIPHPEWFFDFLPSLFLITSLSLILVGSVTSFFQARRVDASDDAPSWGRPASRVVAGALLMLLAVSAVVTVTSRTNVEAGNFTTRLEWAEQGFTGDSIEPAGAGTYRLLLRNSDLTVHTFTWLRVERVDCVINRVGREICRTATHPTGMDFAVGPGSERLVAVTLEPGVNYSLVCNVPGHNH